MRGPFLGYLRNRDIAKDDILNLQPNSQSLKIILIIFFPKQSKLKSRRLIKVSRQRVER